MIYAYDQALQMPIRDLYDSQMMATAIGAAKDMYEKGLAEIKDFKKEYGDFLSPIQKDMDWYAKNVTDKVRNVVNGLYDAGIDPLRSAEGRAAVSRVINSINPAEVNFRKQRAQNAIELQKNIDKLKSSGLYNQQFANTLGENPQDWDDNYIGTTSATPYLDYEQKYGHLFDKMGYEYDPEESKKHPGMQVMTKNKSRMHDILSASRPDLINDPQYKYDLVNLKRSIAEQNPNMQQQEIDSLAIRTLENEIVERNYKGGMQMVEDPIAKENRNYTHQLAIIKAREESQKRLRAGTPGYDYNGNPITKEDTKESLGMLSGIQNAGFTRLSGTTDPTKYGKAIKPNIRNVFNTVYHRLGYDRTDLAGGYKIPKFKNNEEKQRHIEAVKDAYKRYFSFKINPADFPQLMGRSAIEGAEDFGKIQMSTYDIDNLVGENELITKSYGYYGPMYNSKAIKNQLSNNFKDATYTIIPSDQVIPIYNDKTRSIEFYDRVRIKDDTNNNPEYTMYMKLDALNTAKGEVNTGSGEFDYSPITNFDFDERILPFARSVSNALDKKYGAGQTKKIDDPVTGTWSNYYQPQFPLEEINDEYFYKPTQE